MKIEITERELSVIQCALFCAKDEYLKHAQTGPELRADFELQAKETKDLYDKLEQL